MASKRPATTTQPIKKPRAVKKKELLENPDLPISEPAKVKKTTKKAKEEPIAQPSTVPVEKPKRKSNIVAGSAEAKAWSERMKLAREKKKAERNS